MMPQEGQGIQPCVGRAPSPAAFDFDLCC
jgi:hypothetical protein